MKFLLPIFCCLMFTSGYAADTEQHIHDPIMTQALRTLLPEYQRHLDIVHFLVCKKQADPSELLRQATKKDDRRTMAFALGNGAAVDGIDQTTQRTALQLAQSKQAAELLLARGAHADVLTPDGKTVVQLAVEELKPFSLLHVLCQQESIDMNHKEPTNNNTAAHMLFLSKTLPSDMTNRAVLLRLAKANFTTPNKQGKTAQNLLQTHCPRSQARRINTGLKRADLFQCAHVSQKKLPDPLLTEALRKMLPDPLIHITSDYTSTPPFHKKTFSSFQGHKHRHRVRTKH